MPSKENETKLFVFIKLGKKFDEAFFLPIHNIVQAGFNTISKSNEPNSINFSVMLNSSFQ